MTESDDEARGFEQWRQSKPSYHTPEPLSQADGDKSTLVDVTESIASAARANAARERQQKCRTLPPYEEIEDERPTDNDDAEKAADPDVDFLLDNGRWGVQPSVEFGEDFRRLGLDSGPLPEQAG